jgi:hypothetical protein
VSGIPGGRRAKIRNEAARKKLPQNTWPVERKSEQHDGRQADGFGPSLVYRKSQQERQRQGEKTDRRQSPRLREKFWIASKKPVDQPDPRDNYRKAEP